MLSTCDEEHGMTVMGEVTGGGFRQDMWRREIPLARNVLYAAGMAEKNWPRGFGIGQQSVAESRVERW